MLLEFRVKNYRSIKDEQILSLVASADKELADSHLMPTGLKSLEKVVRSSVIYGPNASGKSNLLLALAFMRAVVADSATVFQPGQLYAVQPFRLDAQTSKEPSEFEIREELSGNVCRCTGYGRIIEAVQRVAVSRAAASRDIDGDTR